MAKLPCLLSLSLCLVVLLRGCSARKQPQLNPNQAREQGECQLDNLDAHEPTRGIQSEGGKIEFWDHKNSQFRCAGVAFYRVVIDSRALLLPGYVNAPQLFYVVQGRAIQGTIVPGCPETYHSSREFEGERGGQRRKFRDRHQKIRRIETGDISAVQTGAAQWIYNDGNSTFVAVVLVDTSNDANQLDENPRMFPLSGNLQMQQRGREEEQEGQGHREQKEEEKERGQERKGREHGKEEEEEQEQQKGKKQEQQESSGTNMYGGFDTRLVAESLAVDTDVAEKVQGKKGPRGPIVKVEEELGVSIPQREREEREERERERRREREKEREQEKGREQGQGGSNGLEETICTMKLTENIDKPSRTDIYVPNVGRISTLNSLNLPILLLLQLSAERVVLRRNAMVAPHYNVNAHSVMYVTRGSARVQVVDNNGNTVFDGQLREGKILVLPQNFGVVVKAGDKGFDYVAFKTTDSSMIYALAGRNSVMRAMPVEVIATSYQVSLDDAGELKYSQDMATLLRGSAESQSDEWAFA